MVNSTGSSDLTMSVKALSGRALIFLALFALSCFGLLKRLSNPESVVQFSDKLAMGYAETLECGPLTNGAWTIIPSCINNFLGFAFSRPLVYLSILLILKFLIFLLLFRIFLASLPSSDSLPNHFSLLARRSWILKQFVNPLDARAEKSVERNIRRYTGRPENVC